MSTSPTLPLPTLPTEVILQIFQEECYDDADLASLALVSRRFFPTVQPILYGSNIVHSYHRLLPTDDFTPQEEERSPRDLYYDERTQLYLRTLEENPRLGSHTKWLRFSHCEVETADDMLVCTSPSPALVTQDLLHYATNLDELILGKDFLGVSSTDIWRSFKLRGDKIKTLAIYEKLDREAVRAVAETFPSLTTLTVSGFPPITHRRRHRRRVLPVLHSLETLTIDGEQRGAIQLPFIGPSLRKLRCNVLTAAELDYQRCPGLQHLELNYEPCHADDDYSEIYLQARDLLTKLTSCPSLDTITILNPCKVDHFNMEHWWKQNWSLFGTHCAYMTEFRLPKLRKVIFDGGIFVDQIATFLGLDLKPGIKNLDLVVDRLSYNETNRRMQENLQNAVRGMCEARGINLAVSHYSSADA